MNGTTPLITSVCYVRHTVNEPQACARFISDIFGLQQVASRDGEFAFRSDDRFRTVSLSDDRGDGTSLGIEVWDDAALQEIGEQLRAHGFTARWASPDECQRRYVQSALLADDASGNRIDLVTRPTRSGRRYFPPRDAGIVQFQGIGLRSIDHARDLAFWRLLGAEVTDWVGDIAYLRIDHLHHRIALYPSLRPGLLYAAFEVEALDQIMQNSYFMQENQVKIVQGPGRQPVSQQIFLHVEGPEGLILSYVTGTAEIGDRPRPPRQFPPSATSLCNWGSESKGVPELSAQS
ncbi:MULTISPECIES: VOC family protein [unclassified Bradyrhizobium]|uniref:VOC family protein n=1 Tax=unclassified Bradyrhizobium TaxID=2631580 RepID=UPI00247B239B|nr:MULTISPECIES: VOC family protein [unclassified Bradyrhizobium]WGS17821.1 VOC family protein [Bradyrhizobium sp. ISRA463]WGS24620.1 VOC family protein [Bradyrhizobium sp. ISRA464]